MTPREGERQRRILYAAAFLRALAIGLMAVLIGLYAAKLGLSAPQIGVVLSSALWGAAAAALFTLVMGPKVAERALLVALTSLPVAGAVMMLTTGSFPLLVAAAFIGMFNVHGRDRGAIPIIEQALLPSTGTDRERTRVFAWYNVLLDAGYAAGGLLAALPTVFESTLGLSTVDAMRLALSLFCVLYAAASVLYARLPARAAHAVPLGLTQLSPASKPIVRKISALFLLDAFGGGFIGSALFAYFFVERFAVEAATVAILFAIGRVLSACSHLAAAWLARRIGLINTMVWTHVPTSLLLLTIAVSDSFAAAAFLFLVREALNEMDVPTRQSYVMAVVRPEERMAAAGITSLVRSCGWATAPVLAGWLMQVGGLGLPLVCCAAAKLTYDYLLWREFRRVKPPEEISG